MELDRVKCEMRRGGHRVIAWLIPTYPLMHMKTEAAEVGVKRQIQEGDKEDTAKERSSVRGQRFGNWRYRSISSKIVPATVHVWCNVTYNSKRGLTRSITRDTHNYRERRRRNVGRGISLQLTNRQCAFVSISHLPNYARYVYVTGM